MKEYHLEPKRVQFIYPKEGKNSDLFLIEAVKNGKNGLKMVYPLIIHKDDNTYTDEVSKILEFKYVVIFYHRNNYNIYFKIYKV